MASQPWTRTGSQREVSQPWVVSCFTVINMVCFDSSKKWSLPCWWANTVCLEITLRFWCKQNMFKILNNTWPKQSIESWPAESKQFHETMLKTGKGLPLSLPEQWKPPIFPVWTVNPETSTERKLRQNGDPDSGGECCASLVRVLFGAWCLTNPGRAEELKTPRMHTICMFSVAKAQCNNSWTQLLHLRLWLKISSSMFFVLQCYVCQWTTCMCQIFNIYIYIYYVWSHNRSKYFGSTSEVSNMRVTLGHTHNKCWQAIDVRENKFCWVPQRSAFTFSVWSNCQSQWWVQKAVFWLDPVTSKLDPLTFNLTLFHFT